jgi:hypothetical protein
MVESLATETVTNSIRVGRDVKKVDNPFVYFRSPEWDSV